MGINFKCAPPWRVNKREHPDKVTEDVGQKRQNRNRFPGQKHSFKTNYRAQNHRFYHCKEKIKLYGVRQKSGLVSTPPHTHKL